MAKTRQLPLRVMFQDEARFGRIQEPHRCWSMKGVRPLVGQQLVREYIYIYGAISPKDGGADFLILPALDQDCFALFLRELSLRYPEEYILIFCDGASAHHTQSIEVPGNIMVHKLPPYSPELNPTENIWDDMREKWFKNKAFKSITAVIEQLEKAALFYENHQAICKSISNFSWINL